MVVMLVVTGIASCSKFLETTPLSQSSRESFYQTKTQVEAALAGVYDMLGERVTYGDYMLGRMGLDADEAYYRSTNVVGVTNHTTYTSDPYISNNWAAWYNGINRANLLLENIDKADMDSTAKAVVKGEALFLRGYYHFMLVKNWGDIPLMTNSVDGPADIYFERAPAKDVYEQITKDMIEAEGLVKTAGEVGHGGRINKSAVRGILARVYLHWAGYPVKDESKYQDARDWAYKVMQPDPKDGFQHALNPSYEDVFMKHCTDQYDIKESIWEVEFYGNGVSNGGYSETGRGGSNNGIRYADNDTEEGIAGDYVYSYGFMMIPARTWYTFADPNVLVSSDERRDWSIGNYTISGSPAYETATAINIKVGRYSGKWRRQFEVVTPKYKNAGPVNFPLLRYSDVLLMFAEAENQINKAPTPVAFDAVNAVRRRAYGKDLSAEGVRYISISNAGTAYTSVPTVTISGGGGSGATAKAFVNPSRVITHIRVTNQGSGYTSVPTVTISGGGGRNGTATAVLSNRATSSYLVDAGSYGSFSRFQTLIEEERLRELCFESNRKGDLVRWGKYLEYMERAKYDFTLGDGELGISPVGDMNHAGLIYFQNVSHKDLLWPIPSAEMSLNKGLKVQNPGY